MFLDIRIQVYESDREQVWMPAAQSKRPMSVEDAQDLLCGRPRLYVGERPVRSLGNLAPAPGEKHLVRLVLNCFYDVTAGLVTVVKLGIPFKQFPDQKIYDSAD